MALSGCSPPSSLPIRSAKVYLNDAKNYMHQVRLPEQALKDGAANCLDMAVLFASLMVSCRIDPLILFAPGHAVVGWRDGAGGMEFMQTTGIAELSSRRHVSKGATCSTVGGRNAPSKLQSSQRTPCSNS